MSRKDALKDYVEVNVRIEKFHEKYPNGRILTDIVSWENGVVVMKATVYRDMEDPNEKPSSTGYAYEKEGSSFINKTSALENCETSAVGRALAMLGFEVKKSIASKEEVENAKLNQNKDEGDSPISSKQVGLIKVLVKKLATARNKTEEDCYKVLEIEDITKISTKKASESINKLQAWVEQAEKQDNPA